MSKLKICWSDLFEARNPFTNAALENEILALYVLWWFNITFTIYAVRSQIRTYVNKWAGIAQYSDCLQVGLAAFTCTWEKHF
jgi:hypothetical protein